MLVFSINQAFIIKIRKVRIKFLMVEKTGFEPATPSSQN